MAEARRLPVLKMLTPILGGIPQYTGQEPPDDYINKLYNLGHFLMDI